MKKIMFNDKYGLTDAVLEGRKTQTRRVVPASTIRVAERDTKILGGDIKDRMLEHSPYLFSEVIAVAQSYGIMANEGGDILGNMLQDETTFKPQYCGAGWKNKMFVKADLMPHRIRITDVRIERLQDISKEDCLKEGIYLDYSDRDWDEGDDPAVCYRCTGIPEKEFGWPEKGFAYLIDKVSGKGTWDSNPYVFVYDFKLLK